MNVVYFNLELFVKDKKQLTKVIKRLVEQEFDFTYSVRHGEERPYKLVVNCCWSNNLVWLAKLIEKENKEL